MELLILFSELAQDMLRFLWRRLWDIDLLETSHQSLRTREVTIVFLVGRRADKADGASLQIGFQHVRGVHRSLADGSSPHKGMYLVDIYDVSVALLLDAVHNLLDAILKVTTILGTSQQRADVELIDAATLQTLWHLAF